MRARASAVVCPLTESLPRLVEDAVGLIIQVVNLPVNDLTEFCFLIGQFKVVMGLKRPVNGRKFDDFLSGISHGGSPRFG